MGFYLLSLWRTGRVAYIEENYINQAQAGGLVITSLIKREGQHAVFLVFVWCREEKRMYKKRQESQPPAQTASRPANPAANID